MKRRSLLLASSLLVLPAPVLAALEISGVHLDDEIMLGGRKLILNGAGVRKKYGFSVYVCGLYLEDHRSTLSQIVALPGPKRIQAVLLRDITSDELGDSFLAGIRHNSDVDRIQRIGLQIIQLGQLSVTLPKLRTGDLFGFDYVPATGTTIIINNRAVTDPMPGREFYDALLGIWLGEKPADDTLKSRMLGIKPVESAIMGGFRAGG